MKNENEFNSALSKELRKLSPAVHVLKTCDRFTAGIPDFLIFGYGHTLALECKFIVDRPLIGAKKLLPKHPFAGPQLTYLESMFLAGQLAYGLIAVYSERVMLIFPCSWIPPEGNWSASDFEKLIRGRCWKFDWLDAATMVRVLLAAT